MTGRWFSLVTLVSSTHKIDCHDVTKILLKVALNIITLTLTLYLKYFQILANDNTDRITPSRLQFNPSRATSRIDFDPMDEEGIEGQISAREPLQNREYMSKDMYDSKYGKQISLRKRTKTPIDKVIYLQRYEKLHIFFLLVLAMI